MSLELMIGNKNGHNQNWIDCTSEHALNSLF